MKVNLFKLSSSKSQHPLRKPQRPHSSIFNGQQEASNDSTRPVRIFNSNSSLRSFNEPDKYSSSQLSTKRGPLVISHQIREQVIDKPCDDVKDSCSFNRNKVSEVFTNADSKSYSAKEADLCHRTIDHNITDNTSFSLLPACNYSDKHSEMEKSGFSLKRPSSVRLNTQELIRIANQRKELLSKMEEIAKKKRDRCEGDVDDPLQTSFEIEYNSKEDKDDQVQVNPIVEDNINYQRSSSINNKSEERIDKDKNTDIGGDSNRDQQSQKELCLNQFDDIQFSLSCKTNIPQIAQAIALPDQLKSFSSTIDHINLKSKQEETQSRLEFKIENGSAIIRQNNQSESFCEEEDLIALQDPFMATGLTLKDEVTEVNEIDINRNKIQNETKLIIDLEQEEKLDANHIAPSIDLLSCLRINEKCSVKKPDYSKYITKPKAKEEIEPHNEEEDELKRMNFFEETLKKIPVNNDKVNEDLIITSTLPIANENKRYEPVKQSKILELHLNDTEPIQSANPFDIMNDYQQKPPTSQLTPAHTPIDNRPTQRDNLHKTRANSCGRDRHKHNISPKKIDRKPKKYADLYLKKILTNEIEGIQSNNNVNKPVNLKNVNRSCDGGGELIQNSENAPSKHQPINNFSKRQRHTKSGRNMDFLIENKVLAFDTQE